MSREDFVSYSCFDAQARYGEIWGGIGRSREVWGGIGRYREMEGDFICPACLCAQGTWLLWQQLRANLEGMAWQQGQDRSRSYNPNPRPKPTLTPTLTPP